MITYDPSQPLIFIHVPKCAGTSVRPIVKTWFGAGFHHHYELHTIGETPLPIDFSTQPADVPQIIYGHFNSSLRLGIRDQYPEVRQFVTILRNPLDAAVSTYLYSLKRAEPMIKKSPRAIAYWLLNGGLSNQGRMERRAQQERVSSFGNVENFLRRAGSQILDHFPVEITDENYIDVIETMFVEIGVMEHLDDSVHRIARALGKEAQLPPIPHLNRSRKADIITPEVIAEFREKNALTYKVYDYVLARYADGATGT